MRNEACMKKVRQDGYWKMETRFDEYGIPDVYMRYIKDTMSDKCRSDMDIHKVGACKGCELPQDFDYFRSQGLI